MLCFSASLLISIIRSDKQTDRQTDRQIDRQTDRGQSLASAANHNYTHIRVLTHLLFSYNTLHGAAGLFPKQKIVIRGSSFLYFNNLLELLYAFAV